MTELELIVRRFTAAPNPPNMPQIQVRPDGGIALAASRLPNLDGYRRAVALIADLEALGLLNPGASATNAMEQIVGHYAPMLIEQYDVPPEKIHWIQVDSMGSFDVVRPEFPVGFWRYTRVSVVWTPLRFAPGAPRSAAAFRAAFPDVAETLLCCVKEMAGRSGDTSCWPANGEAN